jgi:hypothetical protein
MAEVGILVKVREDGSVEVKKLGGEFVKSGDKAKAAADKTSKGWDKVKAKTAGWSKSIASMASSWMGLTAAIAGTVKLLKESISLYIQQEKAEKDLAAAMRLAGTYTRANHEEMLEFAQARQKLSKYGDELTLQNMALLQSFGMNTEELKRATRAAQDFASGLGIDLRTASLLVGKAFAGDTATLSRYGIKLEDGLDKTQKFEAAMRQLNKQFGGRALAELDTYAGKIEFLKNQWGDFLEGIGKRVLDTFLMGDTAFHKWLGMTPSFDFVSMSKEQRERLAEHRKKQAAEIKREAEEYEKLKKAVEEYASEIDTLGNKYLELAGVRFSEQLKAEDATLQSLQDAALRYQAVITETYQARRDIHLGVIADLGRQRAEVEKLTAAKIALAESEMAKTEELLKAQRDYYDALKALRDDYQEEYKKKLSELNKFEQDTLKVKEQINALIKAEEKALLGDNRSEWEKYYDQVTGLDQQYAAAMELSGKERMDALQEYIEAVKLAADEMEAIRTGTAILGGTTVYDTTALERMREAQSEWEATRDTIATSMQESATASQQAAQSIGVALDQAAADVNYFANEVLDMQREIENLRANILISVDDQASEVIEAIQAGLDALQDKTITLTTIHRDIYQEAGGLAEGSYDKGTPYVPRDMLAQIHQGEMIVPAHLNPNNPVSNSYDQRQDNRAVTFIIQGGNVEETVGAIQEALALPGDYN